MTEPLRPRAKYVIGPDGSPLTIADLPAPGTKRWVIRRKAEVVADDYAKWFLARVRAVSPALESGFVCANRFTAADISMGYAFMLATPIILAASLKTAPDLIAPAGRGIVGYAVLGCILSAVAAYLSVRFLDRYVKGAGPDAPQARGLLPLAGGLLQRR